MSKRLAHIRGHRCGEDEHESRGAQQYREHHIRRVGVGAHREKKQRARKQGAAHAGHDLAIHVLCLGKTVVGKANEAHVEPQAQRAARDFSQMAAQLRRPRRGRLRRRGRARRHTSDHTRLRAAHSKGARLAHDAKNRQDANERRAHISIERPKKQLDSSACPQARARQAQNRGTARLNGRVGHKPRHQKPESQTADEAARHRKHQARRAQLDKGGPHKTAQGTCEIQHVNVKRSSKGGADATQPACRSSLARGGIVPRSAIFAGNVCSRTPTDKGNHKGSERRACKGSKPTRISTRVVQDGNRQRVDGPGRHAIRKVEPENDERRLQANPKNRERRQGFDPRPPLRLIFFHHGVSPADVWARFAPHISTRG